MLYYLLLDLLCLFNRAARERGVLNVVRQDLERQDVWLKASSNSSAVDTINCTWVDTC